MSEKLPSFTLRMRRLGLLLLVPLWAGCHPTDGLLSTSPHALHAQALGASEARVSQPLEGSPLWASRMEGGGAAALDTTAPSPPVVTQPANNAWVNTVTPVFAGTSEPFSTVTLFEGSTALGMTTADAAGNWSFASSASPPQGVHTVTATATDSAGNTSAPSAAVTFLVDLTPPYAPVVISPVNGALLKTGTLTFNGTAELYSTVKLYVDGSLVATLNADAVGGWTYNQMTALLDGIHSVTATATDSAGNTSPASAAHIFTVDTMAPAAPAVTSPTSGQTLPSPWPTFSGTSEPGSTVTILVDGNARGAALANGQGLWSFALPINTPFLSDGPHAIAARATDPAGNTGPTSTASPFTVDTIAPAKPAITYPVNDALLAQLRPTISGTAEAGSTLNIVVDTGETGSLTIGGSGSWQYTLKANLAQGFNTITVNASDAAGNTSPSARVIFTVDTIAPAAPIVTMPSAVGTAPTFTGTAEVGSTVTIIVDNGHITGSVIADIQGQWSFTLTAANALGEGTHSVQATATDLTGNRSPASPLFSFLVDTTPPAAPWVASLTNGALLNTSRPYFSGTAEAGSTVFIFINGYMVGYVDLSDTSNQWTYTLQSVLNQGPHEVSATARDKAGNTSPFSTKISFSVDSIAPGAPEIVSPASDSYCATARPTLSGTAEPASTVTVRLDGKDYIVTANAQGQWSLILSSALAEGPHRVSAVAQDAARNVSPASAEVHFTVATRLPSAPVVTAPASSATLSTAKPTFTGTADAGSTLTLFVDGLELGHTAADAQGHWSYTLTLGLAEGPHFMGARAADGAGSASPFSAPVIFFVDTLEPQGPRVTSMAQGDFLNDPTPTLAGTAEAGTTVKVVLDEDLVLTTRAGSTGTWSFTLHAPLSEGLHSLSVTTTDAAGNSSAQPLNLSFTVDLTAPETLLSPRSPWIQRTPPSALFEFSSSEGGHSFDCSLDGANFTPCDSPHLLENLAAGEHTFRVRAWDAAGNLDPNPATASWKQEPPASGGFGCAVPGSTASSLMACLTWVLLAARRRSPNPATLRRTGSPPLPTSPEA